jgi:Putative beta-barrel porin-2, OmpL-like. bbp2
MSHRRSPKTLVAAMAALALAVASAPALARGEDAPTAPAPSPTPTPTPSPSPTPAATPDEPAATPPGIELVGFVDTYYGFNFNRPTGDTQLRNFDTKHNQISLGLLEVALEQKPTAASRLGFRADLDFGPTTDMVHAYEPGGADIFKAFEQAYLSWLAPAGKGLQFDVGKFVTPLGAEVIEAKDNWNYSRSLLFALAIPYYHVGVRGTYAVNDRVSFAGFLVNGWNNAVDNNSGKTFGAQAIVKPHAKLAITQNFMAGPEQTDNTSDTRFMSDTTLSFNATSNLSLMANYDYGTDSVSGADVMWQGIAVYARLQATPSWAVSPRFEWLDDADGFMTGVSQSLREATLTSEHKIAGSLLARFELRHDMAEEPFFVKDDGSLSKSQTTFALGLVYAFGTRF